MRFQRVRYLVLVILLSIFLVVGCQPAAPTEVEDEPTAVEEVEEPTAEPEEPTEEPEEEAAEPITLTYTRYAGSIPYDTELVEQFSEEHPNITVEIQEVPGEESFNKLLLQKQGGQMPDVFWSHWVLAAATSNMAIPVDDFIAESGGEVFRDRFIPSAWDFVSWKDETYGVQWRDGASVGFFNESLLEQADLEVPMDWTWDDLVDYGEAMTNAEEGVYAFGLIGSATDPGTEWNFWPFLLQNGGQIIDENNRAAFNSPEGVEALQFLVDLIYEYEIVPPSTPQNDINQVIDLFVSDKIGFWFNGPWYIGMMRGTYPDAEVAVSPMPKQETQGSIAGGTAFCISSQTEHPEEAWMLVEYLTRDEHLTEWAKRFQHVPPNKAGLEEPFITDDPLFQAAALQSEHPDTISANHYPETDQLNQIIRGYLQAAYLQEMTPQEALDAAAAEWDAILQEYD